MKNDVLIFLAFPGCSVLDEHPFFAASEVDLATTKGTASPKLYGQQITNTVTILAMA